MVGKVIASNHVLVPMPGNSALMTQFRRSSNLQVIARGQLFQFKLTGTAQLLQSLQNCVASVKANGIAKARDFTVPQAPKSAEETPRTALASPRRPGKSLSPDSIAQARIEAVELTSNFILKTTLRNPRILSSAETPAGLETGAAWQSDEATGFVRIILSEPGTKGLDVTAAVIAADARDCKGKFASARKSELIDSEVVFEGMMSCEDSDGVRLAHYFLVPRQRGGFVMFSVISNMKTDIAKAVTQEEQLGGFRKAALVAVSR